MYVDVIKSLCSLPATDLNFTAELKRATQRHICPLQLEVIQRCIELWTNTNDIVLDPFAGIGSSPYVAVTLGRRGIGFELKESYYKQAVANLEIAANADKMNCPVGQMSIEDFLSESLA